MSQNNIFIVKRVPVELPVTPFIYKTILRLV